MIKFGFIYHLTKLDQYKVDGLKMEIDGSFRHFSYASALVPFGFWYYTRQLVPKLLLKKYFRGYVQLFHVHLRNYRL